MVVETSALLAIFLQEEDRLVYLRKMSKASRLLLSAASLVEVTAVLLRRGPREIEPKVDAFLLRARITIVPVDETQATIAREAYRRYGRGLHPASLNFGDCFSYALAIRAGEPLLFKGNDFSQTDVKQA